MLVAKMSNLVVMFMFACCCCCFCFCCCLLSLASECGEAGREKVDLDIAKIASLGEHGRPFPVNRAELDDYCNQTRQLMRGVEHHIAKCYERNVRDLANIVLFNVKGIERKLCRRKNGRKLKALLSIAPCINKYAQPNSTCLDSFQAHLEEMIRWPADRDKLKIPFACCRYAASMECIDNFLESQPCMAANKEMVLEFIKTLSQSVVDVMCGDYTIDTDRCLALQQLPPGDKPSLAKPVASYHSLAFPLIDLLLSIKTS